VKNRKLTATIIWASLLVMFAVVCLYFFLLLPEKTTTLAGSSAHWKAEDVVHVQKLDRDFRTSSFDELKAWWTRTPGEVTEVQFQLAGLHGMIEEGDESGSFNPWKIQNTNALISEPQLEYGLVLTITWKGGTETIHLQRQ
jgi:hypothetical protein